MQCVKSILTEKQMQGINDAIEHLIGKEHVTFMLRERDSGEIVYTYRGQRLMRPASNMKIISGAAALKILGPTFRFKTGIFTDGIITDGVLEGNLYIKGGADPTINGTAFKHFSNIVKEQGIVKIKGNLIGDDTLFPGETLPPGVDDEGETHYYGARVSPITMSPNEDLDTSTILITAEPQMIGEKPNYEVIPYLIGHELTNEAVTVAAGEENTFEIRRINGTNQIVMTGQLPQDEIGKVWVSLQNPTINTLQYLKVIFEQEGILFAQASTILQEAVPQTATHLYTYESPTIAEIFPVFMKLSNNGIADIFVKMIGYQEHGVGEYEAGLKSVRAYLQELNIPIDDWQFIDGSGLSHHIQVNSEGISKLLFVLQNEPYFDIFLDSLPIAGNPDRTYSGTLQDRFTEKEYENRIFAKTGYISEVNALAGYVTGDSGKPYIFSIFLEGYEEGIPYIDSGLKEILRHI